MLKYTTKVRIDREILKGLVPQLKADYEAVGNRETKTGEIPYFPVTTTSPSLKNVSTLICWM